MMRSFLLVIAAIGVVVVPRVALGDAASLRHIPESAWKDAPARARTAASWQVGARDVSGGEVSMTRAILYSLALPGWGDYYAGRRERARYFFIGEAAAWSSFAVFRIQAHRDEDAYKDFAVQFAGVTRTDHSDDFYVEVREWNSSDEYEAFLKADGRVLLYPDVGASALGRYYTETRVADFEPWAWESVERRLQYAELRSASKSAYRRSHFSLAAAAVNRVVSAIFAYQAVKSGRGDLSSNARYHIDLSPPPSYDAAVFIVRTF
jgi:hypothetical protein